jgi:tRNA(Ile)-lysidine synthase
MIHLLDKIPNRVTVAVSGGLDSMVALDFLRNCDKRSVDVAYFNHGTRHGFEAEKFVKNFCFRNMLHCRTGKIDRKRKGDESQEEFWRNERYRFFSELRNDKAPIVTAHHLDDAVEWWVFTSLHGESKLMPYENSEFRVIRPFLTTPRSELEAWAKNKNVPFVEDPSNRSMKYMRNIIRHEIIPTALKINPGLATVVKKKILASKEVHDRLKNKG